MRKKFTFDEIENYFIESLEEFNEIQSTQPALRYFFMLQLKDIFLTKLQDENKHRQLPNTSGE